MIDFHTLASKLDSKGYRGLRRLSALDWYIQFAVRSDCFEFARRWNHDHDEYSRPYPRYLKALEMIRWKPIVSIPDIVNSGFRLSDFFDLARFFLPDASGQERVRLQPTWLRFERRKVTRLCSSRADDQETSYDFTQLRADRMNGNPGYLCTKQSGILNTALEQNIEAIINRGGSSPATAPRSAARSGEVRKSVIVYFDLKVLDRVDEVRRSLRIKTSRQRWLMEAIM